MARATGSINYLEHRTPLKDESGKYQIHPMFVKRDTIDQKKMEKHVLDHCAMNVSSFIAALETLEDETLYALADGNEVRVGDMFIVKLSWAWCSIGIRREMSGRRPFMRAT